MSLKIMVTGSRSWSDEVGLRTQLAFAARGRDVELLHGDCPTGADAIADAFARTQHRWTVTPFPPDRSKGRQGRLERNQAMVDAGPDLVLAFIEPSSVGSWHAVTRAMVAGLPVSVFGTEVVTPDVAHRAHHAAGRLVADGGWRSARRRALAVQLTSLRAGERLMPGMLAAIEETEQP